MLKQELTIKLANLNPQDGAANLVEVTFEHRGDAYALGVMSDKFRGDVLRFEKQASEYLGLLPINEIMEMCRENFSMREYSVHVHVSAGKKVKEKFFQAGKPVAAYFTPTMPVMPIKKAPTIDPVPLVDNAVAASGVDGHVGVQPDVDVTPPAPPADDDANKKTDNFETEVEKWTQTRFADIATYNAALKAIADRFDMAESEVLFAATQYPMAADHKPVDSKQLTRDDYRAKAAKKAEAAAAAKAARKGPKLSPGTDMPNQDGEPKF